MRTAMQTAASARGGEDACTKDLTTLRTYCDGHFATCYRRIGETQLPDAAGRTEITLLREVCGDFISDLDLVIRNAGSTSPIDMFEFVELQIGGSTLDIWRGPEIIRLALGYWKVDVHEDGDEKVLPLAMLGVTNGGWLPTYRDMRHDVTVTFGLTEAARMADVQLCGLVHVVNPVETSLGDCQWPAYGFQTQQLRSASPRKLYFNHPVLAVYITGIVQAGLDRVVLRLNEEVFGDWTVRVLRRRAIAHGVYHSDDALPIIFCGEDIARNIHLRGTINFSRIDQVETSVFDEAGRELEDVSALRFHALYQQIVVIWNNMCGLKFSK